MRALALLSSILLAGCSLIAVRSGTEQPAYSVVDRLGDDIEVRSYHSRLAAETTVSGAGEEAARTVAFRLLFDYISGANKTQAKIAMTAPVEVDGRSETIAMTAPVQTAPAGEGRYAMHFFLPTALTPETVPESTDPRVRIVSVPEQTLAVLRWSGSRSAEAVATCQKELLAIVQGSAWRPVAEPVAWFYDPPWTPPFLRRNEVAVPVALRSTAPAS